ncbi:hypothetical protein [Bosea sp. 685]|uniref:hypothetical protein n=1 Tax=Bosea sp. 685 TaxID=3080057 RepID=UPI00289341AC|nr:hypothetical protein [Bosea sp. 685]WNJ89524.1 hypothetical protein RMR04_24430 [Bosea sp. 685]
MQFFRDWLLQLGGVAFLGAAAAFASKVLGVDKSTIAVGLVGVLVGWCACWLKNAWFSQPKGIARPGEAGLTRIAIQRSSIDNSIRAPLPAQVQTTQQSEEKP